MPTAQLNVTTLVDETERLQCAPLRHSWVTAFEQEKLRTFPGATDSACSLPLARACWPDFAVPAGMEITIQTARPLRRILGLGFGLAPRRHRRGVFARGLVLPHVTPCRGHGSRARDHLKGLAAAPRSPSRSQSSCQLDTGRDYSRSPFRRVCPRHRTPAPSPVNFQQD